MTGFRLAQQHIREGVWQGILEGAGTTPPDLSVSLGGHPLGPAEVAALDGRPGCFAVRAAIPPAALGEGVHTFTISTAGGGDAGGTVLAHFTVMTGDALDADLRAELALLRAELDLLKRAFRRHCLAAGDAASQPEGPPPAG